MHDFILVKDKCPKKIVLVTFWYFPDRSVKYNMTPPHRNKGTTYATDLKFSPEVDISDTNRFAKFQVGRSRGLDFTHFLDNRWSDQLEILHAALDYHYLTLVEISS